MKRLKPCLIALMTLLSVLLVSTTALAKEISLYDQPNTSSKVIGNVDLAVGVIPVFTPKNSEWMKVADPRNGNVGWIKSSDIAPGTQVTFSQQLIKENAGTTQTVQTIQVGKPLDVNAPTWLDTAKKIQEQKLQEQSPEVQKVLNNMMENINKLYQQDKEAIKQGRYPLLVPVVVMPIAVPPVNPPAKVGTVPAPVKMTP